MTRLVVLQSDVVQKCKELITTASILGSPGVQHRAKVIVVIPNRICGREFHTIVYAMQVSSSSTKPVVLDDRVGLRMLSSVRPGYGLTCPPDRNRGGCLPGRKTCSSLADR